MFSPTQYGASEQRVQEATDAGIIGGIGKTALSFIAYGVGLKVFRGLAFRANVGLGKFVTQLATPNSPQNASLKRAVETTVSRDTPTEMATRFKSGVAKFQRMVRRTLNSSDTPTLEQATQYLVKDKRYNPRAINKVNASALRDNYAGRLGDFAFKDGKVKDIRFTSLVLNNAKFRNTRIGAALKGASLDIQKTHKYDKIPLGKLLNASPQTKQKANQIIRGRINRYAAEIGSIAAFDYAWYNATMANPEKKWYDPKNVAEWASFTVATDLAFRGAMPNAMKAGKAITSTVGRSMRDTGIGNDIIGGALGSLQKLAHNKELIASKLTIDKLSQRNRGDDYGLRFVDNIRRFNHEKSRILTTLNADNIRNKTNMQSMLERLKKVDDSFSDGGVEQMHDQVVESLQREYNNKQDPNKWVRGLGKLFGTSLKSATENVGRGGIAYKGAGFVTHNGTEYDLYNILPSTLMKKAFQFSHDNLSLGITKDLRFHPLSILGINPLINAAKHNFMLRTNKNIEAVNMGIGYDSSQINAKLDNIINNSEASKMFYDDFIKAGNPEAEFNAKLLENFKNISEGKPPVSKMEDKVYENLKKLSNDTKDLRHASEFIESYTDAHYSGKAGRMTISKEQIEMQLKRGMVNIQYDNEYVMAVGSDMYYGIKDGRNWKSFRLGYDVNKSTYHQFINIGGVYAQGLKGISAALNEHSSQEVVDDTGRVRRVKGGVSAVEAHQQLPTDPSTMDKLGAMVADGLELGSKPERSLLESFTNIWTKHLDPKNFKTMLHVLRNSGTTFDIKSLTGDQKAFLKRMQTISSEAHVEMVDKFTSRSSVIDAISSRMNSFDRESLYKDYKNGNYFVDDALLFSTPGQEYHHKIKKDSLIIEKELELQLQKNNPFKQALQSSDINLLKTMRNSSDLNEWFSQPYAKSAGKITNKEAYNDLVFRTWFKGHEYSRQAEIIDSLQTIPQLSRYKKDLDILKVSDMITSFNNININQLDALGENLIEDYTKNTVDFISNNMTAMEKVASSISPLLSSPSWNNSLTYPNMKYMPDNVVLSANKDDKGNAIYSFTEQMFGGLKNPLTGERINNIPTIASMQTSQALNAINNTANIIGLGFNKDAITSVGAFAAKVTMKRLLPAMAMMTAYNATDTFMDESGLFEGTQFGEGLTPLMANVIGQSRLAIAGVNDALGITSTAKYLEDIMPGFVSSPLSQAVRAVGAPIIGLQAGSMFGPTGAVTGGAIGAAVSLISAGGPLGLLGKYDISKSRAELIEEYSGRREVEVYKGAGWLMGFGPVGGTKVDRFEKNWYHQAMSQYKYTDTLYGSKGERLTAFLDANHYYEKHKESRPYPFTQNRLADTPLVGNIIGFGGKMANEEDLKMAMMADALTSASNFGYSENTGLGTGSSNLTGLSYQAGEGFSVSGDKTPMPISPNSFAAKAQAAYAQTTDLLGLRGFIGESIGNSINGGMQPFEDLPKYQSASWMTSPFRAYWDEDYGDMLGMNEVIRRMIPKHGQHANEINPIRNMMPDWLAGAEGLKEFGKGDPYTLIKKGEARLPGQAYEALHAVKFSFPLESEYFGRPLHEQVAILTGNYIPQDKDEKLDRYMRANVKNLIASSINSKTGNVNVDKTAFNVHSNLSGKLDIVAGNVGMDVHVLSNESFNNLGGEALPQHYAAINSSLIMNKMKSGAIIYYNAETGDTREIKVYANEDLHREEVNRIYSARKIAIDAFNSGGPNIGINMANAYSRLDRLSILADVAPYSDEFNVALEQVKQQEKAGLLSRRESIKLRNIQSQKEVKADRYIENDYRFNRGTAITDEEKRYQEYIDSNYTLPEKVVGGLWEKLAHLHTPVNAKFLNHMSAIESYSRLEVYGQCLLEGTPILTLDGFKFIEELKLTDMVFTREGWKKILDITERNTNYKNYDDYIVKIFTDINTKPLEVTASHPILTNEGWVRADELNIDSKIIFSDYKHNTKKDVYKRDLIITSYLTESQKSKLILFNDMIYFPRKNKDCIPTLETVQPIKSKVSINSDFCYFLGWYIAEGNVKIEKGNIIGICLTLGIHEMETIDYLTKIIQDSFCVNVTQSINVEKSQIVISINSVPLGMLFYNLFGHLAENKHLPQSLLDDLLPLNKIKILEGLFKGDAHFGKNKIVLGVTSEKLCLDVQYILNTFGIKSRISYHIRENCNHSTLYRLTLNKEASKLFKDLYNKKKLKSTYLNYVKNNICSNIIKIIIEPEECIVYDLYVDECHEFTTGYGLVHNSNKDWGDPYGAFVRPFATSALSRDTMGGGALSFGTAGLVFGGPGGAAVGAGLGALYGGFNEGPDIPGYRQRERELAAQIDAIRYKKAQDIYNLTGSLEAKKEMERTLSYQYNNTENINSMYSAVPSHERGFIRKFALAGTVEERERIMELVPEYAKPILNAAWSGDTSKLKEGANFFNEVETPSNNWSGWAANIQTDDIAVKMYERNGLDSHYAGLGWQDQIRKMKYKTGIPDSFSSTFETRTDIVNEIQNMIKSIVPDAYVHVVPTSVPGIEVSIV